jgi:hypothetical protein
MKKATILPFVIGLFVSVVLITAVDIMWAPYLLERYRMDIYFLMGIACFIIIGFWYEDCAEKNRKYANRIVNEKCYKRATKGYNNCEVKISRWYSPTLVAEAIEKMGFEIKRNSKNGRAVLVIKW